MSAVDEARKVLVTHVWEGRGGSLATDLDALIAAVRAESWKDGFTTGVMQMTTWPEDSARLEADRRYAALERKP